MSILQFEIYQDDFCKGNRGIMMKFTDGAKRSRTSYFSGPPINIDHVDIEYLKGRFNNVKTPRHEEFIKAEYKKQLKEKFPQYVGNEIVNESEGADSITPFEEIYQLIENMKEAKETLEGTDIEYFSETQLKLLFNISNELSKVSKEVLGAMNTD